jgi:hypothetical protein
MVAFALCGAYGLLHALSLLTELAYFWTRNVALVTWVPATVGVWVAIAMLASLFVATRSSGPGRIGGVLWGAAVLIAFLGVMLAVEQVVLPHEASIAANFRPRTVAGANLRNTVLYGMPLGVLFILIPFQLTVALQRELAEGRHENVLRLLAKDALALVPAGAVFIRPRVLAAIIAAAAVYLVVANQYLLDNLVAGPGSELFTNLIYVRIAVGIGVVCASVLWYARALDDTTREALALRRISSNAAPDN